MVRARGNPAGGEPGTDRLSPAAADDRPVRQWHLVFLGRAAVPHQGQVDHRPRAEQVFRRRGPVDLYPPHRQHAVYGTKVIVATDREAPYVLDEILGNQTDLPITEHATDTHGASLLNFALFDL